MSPDVFDVLLERATCASRCRVRSSAPSNEARRLQSPRRVKRTRPLIGRRSCRRTRPGCRSLSRGRMSPLRAARTRAAPPRAPPPSSSSPADQVLWACPIHYSTVLRVRNFFGPLYPCANMSHTKHAHKCRLPRLSSNFCIKALVFSVAMVTFVVALFQRWKRGRWAAGNRCRPLLGRTSTTPRATTPRCVATVSLTTSHLGLQQLQRVPQASRTRRSAARRTRLRAQPRTRALPPTSLRPSRRPPPQQRIQRTNPQPTDP